MIAHRIGIGWRPELAAHIASHLDEIDVIEVIADNYFSASRARLRALRLLARQVPTMLHGTSLGLASSEAVAQRRLDAFARVVEAVEPIAWSEHLAFVRGGGVEIGHLAAPPRTRRTLDGLVANLRRAERTIGSLPLLENIATLVDAPLSDWNEAEWMTHVAGATSASFLLDLHNLHANATNFGFDARDVIAAVPPSRIRAIHIAGGKVIRREGVSRILDDHLHPTPAAAFTLLGEVTATLPHRVDVVLERDGAYPAFDELLSEMRHARAVSQGNAEGRHAASA